MRYIVFDGTKMTSKELAHQHMKEALHAKDYYGANLDALHDVLTEISTDTMITFKHIEAARENLQDYFDAIDMVCKDSAEENDNLSIQMELQ